MSYFLSICIPTYNGGENLKYNVNKLIKMQPEFGFEVCVSDNASDDGTQEFMKDIIDKYDFVKYHRNEENLGYAYNFDYVLNMANGKYRWLLGDDDEIVEENLGKVISSLKEYKPDICVVNGGSKECLRVINKKSKLYNNKNEVLKTLGEHMSWISSLIFAKRSISEIKMQKVENNAFPHLIEVFKILDQKCNLLWLENNCVWIQHNNQNRYSDKFLIYFIKDWYNVTTLIGNYDTEAKNLFCRIVEERLFNLRSILSLRARNVINDRNIMLCKNELNYFSVKTKYSIYVVNFIPLSICSLFYKLYKIMKRKIK